MKQFVTIMLLLASFAMRATLIDEIRVADAQADAEVSKIASVAELNSRRKCWRQAWLDAIGQLPARTPLNVQEGPIVMCDGFTLQNILFESMPGVYIVGHLLLPNASVCKPPYPVVLMANGHADNAVLSPRYAAHMAMMARAGFATFSWDPISQGERRQCKRAYDYTDNCSTEHTRLGFRGWLVGWNFARFLVWDGMRALDYLETRKDVDCTNVGICGTSGGGTQSAYLQALDSRIKVAFPNCFVSSIRAVFAERGCHDAEQFFWNQLNIGVNHAAILAMGLGRVSLATGSRWKDYFPHYGAVETFGVYSNLWCRLTEPNVVSSPWHFHCDGPHGLPLPTRQAQVDWMRHCIKGDLAPKPLATYWTLSTGDHSGQNDPSTFTALPFPTNAAFFTATHQVRDLKGFRSLYDVIADRARQLAKERKVKTREQLREIVRRRAGIRSLSALRQHGARPVFNHPKFGWWYLKGAYGCRRENEAAILSTLGRSVVGCEAERIIIHAARQKAPIILRASKWDCIAAAHAYAAEPQLFAGVQFTDPPPSWLEMVTNPDPTNDSFAIAVWGALADYDWPDLTDGL